MQKDFPQKINIPDSYTTLKQAGDFSFTEKRSRFISYAKPISSEDEASAFLEEIRTLFPDATHHVYAWILQTESLRNKYSDDAEPSGTAGLPALEALRNREIINAMVVIVRYYGGIQLGAGGLVRAYSKAAVKAIQAAKPLKMVKSLIYSLKSDYSDFEKIRGHLKNREGFLDEIIYGAGVEARLNVTCDEAEETLEELVNLTNGRLLYEFTESSYLEKILS